MIELTTTWDTIVMLLIAAGVGLIGGVGGALIEMRRPAKSDAKSSWTMFVSSVVLGGIAAVAILYFFPPQETVKVTIGDVSTTTTAYDLTKLVALALIVGSAGSGFLLVLQKRTMDLLNAEKEVVAGASTAVSVSQSVGGLRDQVSTVSKTGAETAAAPIVQKAMEEVRAGGEVTPEKVANVVETLGAQVEETVKESVEPVVEGMKETVLATAMPTSEAPAKA